MTTARPLYSKALHSLTPDPAKLAGGINAYQYVLNPTGWIDPLGLSTCPNANSCKSHTTTENPNTQVTVDEGISSLPVPSKKQAYLYRGDSRHPDEIFETGFNSRGKSTNLYLHTQIMRAHQAILSAHQ
ncbi:hypothetical protein GIW15_27175 [Pseudomonas lurida]|nr:hypothetical protein [Pseudomonas lurida]MCF5310877.1 hypothetical protein [Pseudomonas lurida]MCF5327633.1 hypothetical protein [Pseudomonas lurida]